MIIQIKYNNSTILTTVIISDIKIYNMNLRLNDLWPHP